MTENNTATMEEPKDKPIETEVENSSEFGYLGRKKVISSYGNPDGFAEFTFEGEEKPRRLHYSLYEKLLSDESIDDDYLEMAYMLIAQELLMKIREYEMSFNDLENISVFMTNIFANSRQMATAKLWGGKNQHSITIKDIDKVLEMKDNKDSE